MDIFLEQDFLVTNNLIFLENSKIYNENYYPISKENIFKQNQKIYSFQIHFYNTKRHFFWHWVEKAIQCYSREPD